MRTVSDNTDNCKHNNRTEWPDTAIKTNNYFLSDGQNLIKDIDFGILILKPQSRGNL
jgi:hypothetical protein